MHGVMKFALKAGTGIERGFKNPPLLEQLPGCAPFLNQSGAEFIYNYEHPLAPILVRHSEHMSEKQDDWSQDMKNMLSFCGFFVVGKDEQREGQKIEPNSAARLPKLWARFSRTVNRQCTWDGGR